MQYKTLADFQQIEGGIDIQTLETHILSMLNEEKKIVYSEAKAWHDFFPSFHQIASDLKASGVGCQVEIKTRSKFEA